MLFDKLVPTTTTRKEFFVTCDKCSHTKEVEWVSEVACGFRAVGWVTVTLHMGNDQHRETHLCPACTPFLSNIVPTLTEVNCG